MTITGENSIIKQSGKAKEETEETQIKEQLKLALIEDIMGSSSENVLIDKKENYYILTYNNKKYLYVENEEITEYENTLAYYIENNEFITGDYINYNQETGLNTGYNEDQTFNVTSYDGKWQILYNGTEGYGVQIISTGNILEKEEQDVLILKRKRWI